MILNFKVENYRSINVPVVLSLIPNETKNSLHTIKRVNSNAQKNNEYSALTSIAIYGPNASGKSNIIKALDDFQDFIKNSSDNKPNDFITLYDPFKLNDKSLNKPSHFSIDIVVDNILYTYIVEVYQSEIVREELLNYPKGSKVKIFSRKYQKIIKGNGYEGIFETIKQRTNENQLFLSKAASENVFIPKRVYQKLQSINILTTRIFHSNDFNESFGKFIFKRMEKESETEILDLSKSLINKLDTHVVDFKIKDEKIKTFHLNNRSELIEFEFENESSGTQRLISFIPLVLLSLKKGFTILVDEFERSLHPEIAQYILGLFNDKEINTKGAQFIFATHDMALLNPENKLRRDQIYLIEKNDLGETEMFSLSDIKGIREGNYEKWYSQGRLGGLPIIAKETFKNELIDYLKSK